MRQASRPDLPPADLAAAEQICRLLSGRMAGEALAVLAAATALTVANLNPRRDQDAILLQAHERSADELRFIQDERAWVDRRRGAP